MEEIVQSSEVARSALSDNYLNLNAFARSIKTEVENTAKKPVKLGSIVAALSRLGQTLQRTTPLLPDIRVVSVSTRSGLSELTFNRTPENLTTLRRVYDAARLRTNDFLTVSQGAGEITLLTFHKHLNSTYAQKSNEIG